MKSIEIQCTSCAIPGTEEIRCLQKKVHILATLQISIDNLPYFRSSVTVNSGIKFFSISFIQGRFKNLALNKTVTALSPDSNTPIARLTDGKLNGNAENTGTAGQVPWFNIDLGAEAQVYLVSSLSKEI